MTPESIVSAYRSKYEDDDTGVNEDSDIQIVFVKRKRFKLTNLVLDKCGILETGPCNELQDICAKVTECDLSHNHISSWNEVFKLLDVGKHIKFLNLSNNKLALWDNKPGITLQYPVLQDLVLSNNSEIEWGNLLELLPHMPALKKLNIGHSNLSKLEAGPPGQKLPDLSELNLINNKISCFSDVRDLADLFPGLTTLVLSDNPLSSFGPDTMALEKFGKIEKLHLNYITISTWDEVTKLRWFPKLSDVRMVHWNLFGEMEQEERRKTLTALLPNIFLINGSPIPERDSAERWYLRRCQGIGNTDSNRYKELYEKWGDLPELRDIKLGAVQEETIKLKILVPERAIEMERTFSVYDTYRSVRDKISRELKVNLRNYNISVQKPDIEQKLCIFHPTDKLYMTFNPGLLGDVPRGCVLEDGDCLLFEPQIFKFIGKKAPRFLK